MRIRLISPRMSLRPMDSELKRRMSPSLALLVLGALTPPEHEVVIDDENIGDIPFDPNADLIGITMNVDTSQRAYAIADRYRAAGIPVVAGGIHPSARPEETLVHVDAVCIGEAETLWRTILADSTDRRLQRTYFQPMPTPLDQTPEPRWELVDRDAYLYTNIMTASRGCCFHCEFCYNSCDYVHKTFRNRPIDHVLAEIEKLRTRQVMFIDDNFIGNLHWARAFTERIRGRQLTWHAAVSTNIGKQLDLLDAMAETGCRSLFVGFESLNAHSLASVGKRQNQVREYEKTIAALHDRGIMVNASMAFGFDYDSPDVFDLTHDWLVANRVETLTSHILTPYPGTKLYDRLSKEGRIIDHDHSRYNTSNVVFLPKQMTPEQLREGYLGLYDRFYSVSSILSRVPRQRRNRVPYFLFNLGYRKFGRITSRLGTAGLMARIGRLARTLSYGIE